MRGSERMERQLGNPVFDAAGPFAQLSRSQRNAIIDAWMAHRVLRFRGQQGMSTQQLVDFSKMFGELDRAPTPANKTGKPYLAEFPQVTAISNIVVDGVPHLDRNRLVFLNPAYTLLPQGEQ